jgi:hypothetical protein
MLSIGRFTGFGKNTKKFGAQSFKKLTSLNRIVSKVYQPQTRFEKLRQSCLVFPKSTASKIVFISNSHGNGFRNENDVTFPEYIPVQHMKRQVDDVCYLQWKEYRDFLYSDNFSEYDKSIKALLVIGLTVILCFFASVLSSVSIEAMSDTLIFMSAVISNKPFIQ